MVDRVDDSGLLWVSVRKWTPTEGDNNFSRLPSWSIINISALQCRRIHELKRERSRTRRLPLTIFSRDCWHRKRNSRPHMHHSQLVKFGVSPNQLSTGCGECPLAVSHAWTTSFPIRVLRNRPARTRRLLCHGCVHRWDPPATLGSSGSSCRDDYTPWRCVGLSLTIQLHGSP